MPTSPSHCSEQKEAGSDTNTFSEQASSSQHEAHDDGAHAMVVMMERGSRLMPSRSLETDDEQATYDQLTRSTASEPTKTKRGECHMPARSSSNSDHVAGSGSEHGNAIGSSRSHSAAHGIISSPSMRPTHQAFAAFHISATNESAGRATADEPSPHKSLEISSSVAAAPIPAKESVTQIRKRGVETSNSMSIERLVPTKKPRRKRTPEVKPGQSTGRWTHKEHQAFLEGLRECGREWKKVALRIPTRTSAQIRSHAQKYFSKLQRDQENMVMSDGSATATVPAEGATQQLTPSVQRNVERILAHPRTVEREVDHTLGALRERYRQLQQRLEQRHRQRGNAFQDGRRDSGPSDPHRKGFLENINERSLQIHDDHSSVSSAVSASVASTSTRDFGDEELIALQVLGGSLPRGDSSTEGVPLGEPAGSRSSDASTATNTEEHDHEENIDERRTLQKE